MEKCYPETCSEMICSIKLHTSWLACMLLWRSGMWKREVANPGLVSLAWFVGSLSFVVRGAVTSRVGVMRCVLLISDWEVQGGLGVQALARIKDNRGVELAIVLGK